MCISIVGDVFAQIGCDRCDRSRWSDLNGCWCMGGKPRYFKLMLTEYIKHQAILVEESIR